MLQQIKTTTPCIYHIPKSQNINSKQQLPILSQKQTIHIARNTTSPIPKMGHT